MAVKRTRGEPERRRHRREILAAALDLFSRKGFDRTSMAEIAEQAEFAVGTKDISNVFPEELIERPDDFSTDKLAAFARQMFFDQVRLKRTGRAPSHR